MSNSYFQFKQFRIEQDRAAMKVSTDACIQGAWTPVPSYVTSALDIGTGTGLLSLMLAQRNKQVRIHALELDPDAAQQANDNVASSPWQDRITVAEADVRTFPFTRPYDLIICNPPFFSNSLLGPADQRNKARHTLSLSFQELFEVIKNNLAEGGCASVMLPPVEHAQWSKIIQENGWNIYHQLNIQPRVGSPANRVVSLCRAGSTGSFISEDLVIKDKADHYTPEFIHLLRPFYLAL
jgi:tRNA1Val (adenine37-N6)-methyltransferase